MCGIGGVFLSGSKALTPEHLQILDVMGEEMKLRGPDDTGIYAQGSLGLVHRRLAIIDLDRRSNQPMESADWVLCYNGEIYNYREIRAQIGKRFQFKTESDSEVLLAGLQVLGLEKILELAAGMFAFLACDKRDGSLYAARDPLGIKPLLMSQLADGGFCFASSVSAIVQALPDRKWTQNRNALGSYFSLGGVSTPDTVYEGIERVAPAEYIHIDKNGGLTRKTYWTPQYTPEFSMDDLVAIVEEYQNSDVQSALFLSGGVDSTFLAAATEKLDCFHLTSPERHYAIAVAQRFNRKFIEVTPDLSSYAEDMSKAIRFHGEPMMSCGIPYVVSKEIRAKGYKMAISANGADELFHGYHRTPAPEWTHNQLPFHEEATNRWFNQQIGHIFRNSSHFDLNENLGCLSSRREIAQAAMQQFHLDGFPPSASYRWFELMSYVLSDLNPTLDAASMGNSLEVRVPFLDHRIVQGVLSWDADTLITPKRGRKAPLKEYLEQWFPAAFFNRQKLGFSIHRGSLDKIARLGPDALTRYQKSGRVKITGNALGENYERDIKYMGNSCHAHELWSNCGLPQ